MGSESDAADREWEALDAYLRDEDDGEQDYSRRCEWAGMVRLQREDWRRNRSALEAAHDRLDTLLDVAEAAQRVQAARIRGFRDERAENALFDALARLGDGDAE